MADPKELQEGSSGDKFRLQAPELSLPKGGANLTRKGPIILIGLG